MTQGVTSAVVVSAAGTVARPGQLVEQLALFNPDGTPLVLPQTASSVKLTGYAIGTAGAVAATDSILQAFAKLEKRVKDLEDAP